LIVQRAKLTNYSKGKRLAVAIIMPFLKASGQDVYYKHVQPEDGNGITLLFVHGLGSSHAFYATIVPSLVQKGFSCLSIDTPGSGMSPAGSKDKSPREIAQIAASTVSSLGIDPEKVLAVGHSMGSMIVCELALEVPLRGLVLIGPVHPTAALGDIFSQRIQKVEQSGLEALADTIPTAATGTKSQALHHAFIRALILSQTPKGYISLCQTISNAKAPQYDSISCPVLIIAGGEDKTSPLSGCNTILESWGGDGKQIEVLEGVGHWHCIEDPAGVGALIEGFASKLA
jgi:pimeloyl-ACP methyl ester carboxylesterase